MKEEIIIAGFGGQGVLSMGKILAYAGLMEGKEVMDACLRPRATRWNGQRHRYHLGRKNIVTHSEPVRHRHLAQSALSGQVPAQSEGRRNYHLR